eukprot:6922610-Lingulodinium_polyedra.AAC.1
MPEWGARWAASCSASARAEAAGPGSFHPASAGRESMTPWASTRSCRMAPSLSLRSTGATWPRHWTSPWTSSWAPSRSTSTSARFGPSA